MIAEKNAPRMKAIERPNRIEASECVASEGTGSTKKMTTASTTRNTATVRNWRDR